MFRAKILEVIDDANGDPVTFKVEYTDDVIRAERDYQYSDYDFKSNKDILNFLKGELAEFNAEPAVSETIHTLVGVEDVVTTL